MTDTTCCYRNIKTGAVCQFDLSNKTLDILSGKQYCPMHLPEQSEDGKEKSWKSLSDPDQERKFSHMFAHHVHTWKSRFPLDAYLEITGVVFPRNTVIEGIDATTIGSEAFAKRNTIDSQQGTPPEDLLFTDCHTLGRLTFKEINFRSLVTFASMDFTSDLTFIDCTFYDGLTLKGSNHSSSVFGGRLVLIGCNVSHQFTIEKYIFTGEHARSPEIIKISIKGSSQLYLHDIEMNDIGIDLRFSEFQAVTIIGIKNLSSLNLSHASIDSGNLYLGDIHSNELINLDGGATGDGASLCFNDVTIKNCMFTNTSIQNREILGETRITDTTFVNPPKLYKSSLHPDTYLEKVDFTNKQTITDTAAYRELKNQMKKINHTREEERFYEYEQRSNRICGGNEGMDWFISWCYDHLSQYGNNLKRPLVTWAILSVVFLGLALCAIGETGLKMGNDTITRGDITTHLIMESFIPFYMLKIPGLINSGYLVLITIVHSLANILLLALFALAVRRKNKLA